MTLANAISLARVLIAPLFAVAFIRGQGDTHTLLWLWIAFSVLVIISVSDFLDGFIARRFNQVTDFGKLFDPLSDSLCNQIVFVSFVVAGIIPFWMLLIILYRETTLIVIRFVSLRQNVVVAARFTGKLKTFLQGVAVFCVMSYCIAHYYAPHLLPSLIGGHHPAYWIMLSAVIASVLSMVDYIIAHRTTLITAMNTAKH